MTTYTQSIKIDGNNLTGQSGNAVNAMLAAYDPFSNLSAISLKDRKKIVEYFGFEGGPDFANDPVGKKIVVSNAAILDGFRKFGITNNARTVSVFLYASGVKERLEDRTGRRRGPVGRSQTHACRGNAGYRRPRALLHGEPTGRFPYRKLG